MVKVVVTNYRESYKQLLFNIKKEMDNIIRKYGESDSNVDIPKPFRGSNGHLMVHDYVRIHFDYPIYCSSMGNISDIEVSDCCSRVKITKNGYEYDVDETEDLLDLLDEIVKYFNKK